MKHTAFGCNSSSIFLLLKEIAPEYPPPPKSRTDEAAHGSLWLAVAGMARIPDRAYRSSAIQREIDGPPVPLLLRVWVQNIKI